MPAAPAGRWPMREFDERDRRLAARQLVADRDEVPADPVAVGRGQDHPMAERQVAGEPERQPDEDAAQGGRGGRSWSLVMGRG